MPKIFAFIYPDIIKNKEVVFRTEGLILSLEPIMDIYKISQINVDKMKQYQIVLLDYRLRPQKINKEKKNLASFYKILKHAQKICLILIDYHETTFDRSLLNEFRKKETNIPGTTPGKGCQFLSEKTKEYNIKHFLVYYNCKELNNIVTACPHLEKVYVLPFHMNMDIYNDYDLPKIYDILIFGRTDKEIYPLRFRLKELLLANQHKFKIKYIPRNPPILGIELAKIINQSWLSLSTKSNFDYLVRKYFEISACKSVVFGNMPDQGRAIWGNNFIEIKDDMTDEQILYTLEKYLNKKEKLVTYINNMGKIIQEEYNSQKYASKILNIFHDILHPSSEEIVVDYQKDLQKTPLQIAVYLKFF